MAEHTEDPDPRPAVPAHPEPAHLEPAHLEPAHLEPAHPEPVHPEPAHPEPAHPERSRRGGRRVRTAAPDGSDPAPKPEPPRHAPTENDERLFGDKPPHY